MNLTMNIQIIFYQLEVSNSNFILDTELYLFWGEHSSEDDSEQESQTKDFADIRILRVIQKIDSCIDQLNLNQYIMNETEGAFYLENNKCIEDPNNTETAEIPLGTQFVRLCQPLSLSSFIGIWRESWEKERKIWPMGFSASSMTVLTLLH